MCYTIYICNHNYKNYNCNSKVRNDKTQPSIDAPNKQHSNNDDDENTNDEQNIDILYRNDNINDIGHGNDDNIIRLRSQESGDDIQTNDVNVKDKGEVSAGIVVVNDAGNNISKSNSHSSNSNSHDGESLFEIQSPQQTQIQLETSHNHHRTSTKNKSTRTEKDGNNNVTLNN